MRCVVLMSTYNGEAHVKEQLCSILAQLPLEGELHIRDDGSSDRTVAIIKTFQDSRIRLVEGRNLGFACSFFTLLSQAPAGRDMYMLSDQDDVWLPNKIERAWASVSREHGQPFLYCSSTQLVDAELRPLGVGRKTAPSGRLIEALTDNQVTGCTVAMNAELWSMSVPDAEVMADVHFHDWWLYVMATAFGKVFCDPEPTLLYRQHGGNFIGAGAGWAKYVKMLAYLRRRNWLASMVAQVHAFRASQGGRLRPDQLQALDTLHRPGHGLRRWSLMLGLRRHRASWTSEGLFRLLLLLDWRHPGVRPKK